MQQLRLHNVLTDSSWKNMSEVMCKQIGAYPNRVRYDDEHAVIIVRRARRGDFALSQPGFDYHVQSERDNRRRKCYVALFEVDGTFIASMPVLSLKTKLNGAEVFPGMDGKPAYWWINERFEIKYPNEESERPY